MRRLEELCIYHVITPLSRPYVLPFGSVEHFNSFVAVAVFGDGARFGESTPLPGYSHETAALMAREFEHLATDGDLAGFLRRNNTNPFVTAPLLTCLDVFPLPTVAGPVPLCPILQYHDYSEIAAQVAWLALQGNTVIKVKLSPYLEDCHQIIRHTQRAGEECGVRFRYDANQTLTPEVANVVVKLLCHSTTELLEQPFPVDHWDQMAALHARSPVPLMLDESIVNPPDVERAARCAHLVKLKLAKNGSPWRLLALIRRAQQLGLDVVLGNGVQGTIGCLLEAKVQLVAALTRPGEMNGFRKIRHDPLAFLIQQDDKALIVPATLPVAEIRQALEQHATMIYRIPIGAKVLPAA
jgi:O-succinylbenzoate synthase